MYKIFEMLRPKIKSYFKIKKVQSEKEYTGINLKN